MKYDIKFHNPFQLGLDIVETKEKTYSIGCNVGIQFELPRSVFEYKATNIWFECSVIDKFEDNLKELYSGKNTKPELYDIDREVIYSFNKEEITISVQRINSEKGSAIMQFNCDYDPEILALNIDNLGCFAKWW